MEITGVDQSVVERISGAGKTAVVVVSMFCRFGDRSAVGRLVFGKRFQYGSREVAFLVGIAVFTVYVAGTRCNVIAEPVVIQCFYFELVIVGQ